MNHENNGTETLKLVSDSNGAEICGGETFMEFKKTNHPNLA